MSFRQLAGLLVCALLLAGCATPYQPRGATGGYTEIDPYEGRGLLVVFAGNGYTPASTARSYALYRAAELAGEKGWQYIRVENKNLAPDTFRTRLGADNEVGQPVVVLRVKREQSPAGEKVKQVDEILAGTTVIPWSPLEPVVSLVP